MKKLDNDGLHELLNYDHERVFFDFKQEHHQNKASLIHDILCLLNSDYKGTRYLIFGISDKHEIIGIDEENKLKDHHVINMLRDNLINRIPELHTYSLEINSETVDILHITNPTNKPYFLTKNNTHGKKTVRAGVIYSRNGSSNTPINSTSSEADIEKMWRERFGLTLSPLERFYKYIEDTNGWCRSKLPIEDLKDNRIIYYYNTFPEFRIIGESEIKRTFMEHWNNRNSTSNQNYKLNCIHTNLMYHSTSLQTHIL